MIASSIRYSDVFLPGPRTGPSIGGTTGPDIQGVWRRFLYVGRGIGGKYLTALDVTAPGPYTARALQTMGPIPIWNRGNPDTTNGIVGGPAVNAPDLADYATMGETWSVPAVSYVNTAASRADPLGTNFVLYVGSGFGATGEGTTFYTLDALTGDVLASADVEPAAAAAGLTRSPADLTYITESGRTATIANALVANAVAFAPGRYAPLTSPHPAKYKTTRVYIGDLYGRFWKFLSAFPDVPIPVADLGVRQPAATAATVIGLPALPPPADQYLARRRTSGCRPGTICGAPAPSRSSDSTTTAPTSRPRPPAPRRWRARSAAARPGR